MNRYILFILAIIFLECTSENKRNAGDEIDFDTEEVTLDSLSLEQVFADTTLKNVNVAELKSLAQNLPDTSRFSSITFDFFKLDSIKKTGNYEKYLESLDIGMAKDVRAVQYKTLDLGNGRVLKLWGFDYATFEACPYSEVKVIFISSFLKDKNVGCVPFAYLENSADAPFYFGVSTKSKLLKNGGVQILATEKEGGVDDDDKEYETTQTTEINFRFVDGSFVRV